MRLKPTNPFAGSTPIDHTSFVTNAIIPPSIHHTGRIKVVWGLASPEETEIPILRFSFKESFVVPAGYRKNDYVVPTAKEEVQTWEIILALFHPEWTLDNRPESAKEQERLKATVQEVIKWAEDLFRNGEEITVDLAGLKVVKTLWNDQKYQVELQGIGQRLVRFSNSEKTRMIFKHMDPSQSTSSGQGPPAWFNSSLPTVSSPVAPHSSANHPESPTAKSSGPNLPPSSPITHTTSNDNSSSRFRPLLSHKPPALTAIPTRPATSAQHQHTAVSTTTQVTAPKKRSAAQIGPPGWELMLNDRAAQQQSEGPSRPSKSALEVLKDSSNSPPEDSEQLEHINESPIEPPDSTPLRPDVSVNKNKRSSTLLEDDGPPSNKLPRIAPAASPTPATATNPVLHTLMGPTRSTPALSSNRSSVQPLSGTESSPALPTKRTPVPVQSLGAVSGSLIAADHADAAVPANDLDLLRRREMEARVRASRVEQQAESSRAAQMRAAEQESLKQRFIVNNVCYSPLNQIRKDTIVNIVGVVVEAKAVNRPREVGRDNTMSIVIADPSRHPYDEPGQASEELMVITLFRPIAEDLPQELVPGCVILLRGVKVTYYNNKIKGQCFNQTGGRIASSWVIMKGDKKIKITNEADIKPPIGRLEADRMTQMLEWWQGMVGCNGECNAQRRASSAYSGTSSPMTRRTSADTSRPDMMLGSVRPGDFFNATFKILWVNVNVTRKPSLELYVTDGTVSNTTPRNFHNVQYPSIPPRAILCLAIFDAPPESERPLLEHGNILSMENVRCKDFNGQLELGWSEKVTEKQLDQGWRARRTLCLVEKNDERAKIIEKRLKQLERGETLYNGPDLAAAPVPDYDLLNGDHSNQHLRPGPSATPNRSDDVSVLNGLRPNGPPNRNGLLQFATHISTLHLNPVEHPVSTISEIRKNRTLPNKYRIHARVKSLHPRSIVGSDSFVQPYCNHCRATFKHGWTSCKSCNDEDGKKAEWRYRFVAILQEVDADGTAGEEMAVIVADEEAAEFLPPLPPYSTRTNPNEIARTNQRRSDISGQVYNILQGCKMDNIRPKPIIDFSLMVYILDKPMPGPGPRNGSRARSRSESESAGESERASKGQSVIVTKVFGMKCRS
ncbi:hypothetical protein IAT40_005167 [Kwoniella sp. CBS 6097]